MTFREWIVDLCVRRGMFDEQANAVAGRVVSDERLRAMAGRWDDDVARYPSAILDPLGVFVNRHALAYIEENCTYAWLRPLFETDD